ncbi:FAD/NAD-P-binding domain-containing protein [Armillaria novae-zelandiae]|uniref:FAD/NAD-P-binding domain-containing protein n=1 Tax=Armillaria novae-zelandiae TaxID=153914 RepID=A0AA39PHM7_9AGAR|nr:FAD/NAD-P-binding domain-containing protein [Armillaria novae-zelandiae]
MLPETTSVLIIGAGPTGLAVAIALVKQGIRNIVVVDAQLQGQNSSRAVVVHAATLEALESIGCVDAIIANGVKGRGMMFNRNNATFISAQFQGLLAPYTRYDFVLLVPQTVVEDVLHAELVQQGIQVLRPQRVVGMASSTDNKGLDVTFESGEVIRANYVIGADGKNSVVRELAGISYVDPDNTPIEDSVAQLVLADVVFSPRHNSLSNDSMMAHVSPSGVFLTLPLPSYHPDLSSDDMVHRIIFNIPASLPAPPSNPSTEYLQNLLNTQGPAHMSSDPAVNQQPIHIAKTVWSSRYRTSSAIADTFFKPLLNEEGPSRGRIILVGDAAHTHSPFGGQGMNLGIRDAVFLAPALEKSLSENKDDELESWATVRRTRALTTIQMTKQIAASMNHILSPNRFVACLSFWIFRFMTGFAFMRRMAAWRLSGLGNR